MNFNELALNHTIDLLLKGKDYREVVLNTINTEFLDFAISFLKILFMQKCMINLWILVGISSMLWIIKIQKI
ncbi:restriction endonuclease [Helicobacter pylori]|nr:restriction endonuclease [Helicobacter pylori]